VTFFGRRYAHPFGIGPTGFGGLMRKASDIHLASAAAAADIPIIPSGASIAPIERVKAVAPANVWARLYPAKDVGITDRILDRYATVGVAVLVVTVDNPVFPSASATPATASCWR
jgi:isopentenyl diphosphate isomerase/L-lactate dehydrogenase-like FMN-dependent dehydrogenase